MNVAIFGYGVVGSGVHELLKKVKDINVVRVFDREEKRKELGDLLDCNYERILGDSDIDLVVEAMGGNEFAYKIIKMALENRKHVVTSNKEVVSLHLKEFNEIANKSNVMFLFEASVGGGIPIIKGVINNAKRNKIDNIYGIMNGTTNYILSNMSRGVSFDTALKEAQRLGYAEADPTADLMGLDMVRKIAILTMLSTNMVVDIAKIIHQGIENITDEFIKFVLGIDCSCKFIAESILLDNNKYHISVLPIVVKKDSLLAMTNECYNSIFLDCVDNGRLLFNGLGAGKFATASAVVSDIIDIYENNCYMNYRFEDNVEVDNNYLKRNYYVIDENNEIKYLENVSLNEIKNYKFYALDWRNQ